MNQSSNTVRALEARIRVLELEYARLNERLRTVGAALGGTEPPSAKQASAPVGRLPLPQPARQAAKSAATSPGTALKNRQARAEAKPPGKTALGSSAKKAKTGSSRKWFEKGEALALFRTLLKRPMRTRDLMVRVIAAKRKGQLAQDDLGRFKWAVHAALKEAISANAIVRQDDGTIALAPANGQLAGKSARKAQAGGSLRIGS